MMRRGLLGTIFSGINPFLRSKMNPYPIKYLADNVLIENHGLIARMNVKKFEMQYYMSKNTRASTIGFLSALLDMTTMSVWYDPNFIIRGSKLSMDIPDNFFLSFKIFPTEECHKFFNSEISSIDNESRVVQLKTGTQWQTDVTYIGNKIYALTEHLTTNDGRFLGTMELICGNHNHDRKLNMLSETYLNKKKYLNSNIKPPFPKVLDVPKNTDTYILEDTVTAESVDRNGHANFAYFIDQALQIFYQVPGYDEATISEFSIDYINESLLGDTVKSTVWHDDNNKNLYCRLTKNEEILSFIHARCEKDHSKAKL